jgi:hypothetical protein
MKITFYNVDDTRIHPKNSLSLPKELPAVPQVGNYLIIHGDGGSEHYQVINVTFVLEERETHQGKDYSSESIVVGVRVINRGDIK